MECMTNTDPDRVIFRAELMSLMNVTSESVRRWMVAGRLPKPDVAISRKTLGWRLSTLRAAGINIA
jgi:predicted DNA-binding transcriptional regulator AlpA